MKVNVLSDKSYNFALATIRLYKILKSKKEYDIARQILRSGTSIGANIMEAQCAFSKKDFLFKLTISYKETKETQYWLKLIFDSGLMEKEPLTDMLIDCNEIFKILSSAILTTKNSLMKK